MEGGEMMNEVSRSVGVNCDTPRRGLFLGALVAAFVLATLLSPAAQAQPFGAWLTMNGSNGYIQIPHSTALNPTGAITIEAWVSSTNSTSAEDCRSIAGK